MNDHAKFIRAIETVESALRLIDRETGELGDGAIRESADTAVMALHLHVNALTDAALSRPARITEAA